MVGPFFYINSKILGCKGILYDAIPEEITEVYGDNITNPHGHSDLFERKFGQTRAEYFNFPRGRGVLSVKRNLHVIYVDKCVIDQVLEIVRRFQIDCSIYSYQITIK